MNLPFPHEVVHKELDLIQAVVTRMGQNSFQVKTWFLAGLSVIAAFGKESLFVQVTSDEFVTLSLGLLVLIIALTFWWLDAFFLSTEKLYRELYKWVLANRATTSRYLYDLNTFEREASDGTKSNLVLPENSTYSVMWSKTLRVLYLPVVLFLIGVNFFNLISWLQSN